MDSAAAALRPLDDAAATVERLPEYTSAELGPAVQAVWAAVDQSLRILLRDDPEAPDQHRLTALSEAELPADDVVRSLRARHRISLETAGAVHGLRGAAERAGTDRSRASDADAALEAVKRLREDIAQRVEGGPAEGGTAEGAPDTSAAVAGTDTIRDADAVDPDRDAVPPERRDRWMAVLGVGLAAVFLLALGWVLFYGAGGDYDDAVAAFRAGRLDSAAVAFEGVVRDQPENVTALLYLARIHRRQGDHQDAANVLQRAADVAPDDPDVRRELGHLFMDLSRPESAVAQYERALEQDPESTANWAGLIRALRAAGDPRAESLLQDAPADVQALLGRAGPQP